MRRSFKLIVELLAVLAISACSVRAIQSSNRIDHLKTYEQVQAEIPVGSTVAFVQNKLGEPTHRASQNGSHTWMYITQDSKIGALSAITSRPQQISRKTVVVMFDSAMIVTDVGFNTTN